MVDNGVKSKLDLFVNGDKIREKLKFRKYGRVYFLKGGF